MLDAMDIEDIKVGDTVRICSISTSRYGQQGTVTAVRRERMLPVAVAFPDGKELGYAPFEVQGVSGE